MLLNNDTSHKTPARKPGSRQHEIKPSPPDFALSEIANRQPSVPATPIAEVLKRLKHEWIKLHQHRSTRRKTLIAGLLDFEIFRSPAGAAKWAYELSSLHLLAKGKELCFSGTIQLGGVKHYVENAEISGHSIEGFGDAEDPGVVIYIQPKCALSDPDFDIWFRLHTPASRYSRFHTPFQWVANFAKHVIDYMEDRPQKSVKLEDFRTGFFEWLYGRFGHDVAFKEWHVMSGDMSDFCVAFHAYVSYIYQQADGLENAASLLAHPVWSHCMKGSDCIKKQPVITTETIATPHVYICFKHMYFGEKLKSVKPCKSVRSEQAKRKRRLGFASDSTGSPHSNQIGKKPSPQKLSVLVGDVIAFKPEEKDKMYWKKTDSEWLAYVQRVEPLDESTNRLFVLWIYRPEDTNMFLAHYPIEREVFLSDNCNCEEGILLSSEVSRKLTVDWLPSTLDTSGDVLIRQTYITQESSFVTSQKHHLTCACRREKLPSPISYHRGDTIYITKTFEGEDILEPALIHYIDQESQMVTVRLFLRLGRDCADIAGRPTRTVAQNELVLTDELMKIRPSRIGRPCNIRFLARDEIVAGRVPFPYDRGGAGDFYFISMGLQKKEGLSKLIYILRLPTPFKQHSNGLDDRMQKLSGLSLFSGGGNLDRGLEEGGAVEFKTAVDFSPEAIHTQRANARDPDNMEFFCGSVDDHLAAIFSGRLPLRGYGFISAGSPCPGFSAMQQDFLSSASLSNASHVSTFCSYVDIVRPKYGILENVVNMASTRKGFESENVMSQLVACVVSLGYQVSQFIIDSWTCGSCQQRSRVFLVIAAPGLAPIMQPKHTHSMPYGATSGRSLGFLPNGQKFGEREHYPTPFPIVTAGEGTAKLPDIGNGNVQLCIPYPDHRLSSLHNRDDRGLIENIPRNPPGSGYASALHRGLIPTALQKANKKELGRCFQRVMEKGLMPTITTGLSPQNGRGGATLHWSQPRPLSVQCARQAQGYPDYEVIIGSLSKQWTIVGNGVDRKVSLALGFSLYQAATVSQKRFGTKYAIISSGSEADISESPSSDQLTRRIIKSPQKHFSSLSNNRQATLTDESEDELALPVSTERPQKPLAAPGKRNHDISLEADQPYLLSSTVVKRVKTDFTATTLSSQVPLKDTPNPPITLEESSEGSSGSQRTRHTRVSGLQVEFIPKSWDKRPEQRQIQITATETRSESSTASSKSAELTKTP